MATKKQKMNDIILITVLFIVAFFGFLALSICLDNDEGDHYVFSISVDGETVFYEPVESLALPFEYKVDGAFGGENIFLLEFVSDSVSDSKGGGLMKEESQDSQDLLDESAVSHTPSIEDDESGAKVVGISCIYSDCPEQICVHTGTVTRADTPIVCLPHRVIATLIIN